MQFRFILALFTLFMAQSSGLDETAFPSVEDAQVELFFNPTAEGYTRLGFAYQNHDLKLHQAGKFQTLALDSYCRALALNPEANLVSITCY